MLYTKSEHAVLSEAAGKSLHILRIKPHFKISQEEKT
jgi:hypothetical protein